MRKSISRFAGMAVLPAVGTVWLLVLSVSAQERDLAGRMRSMNNELLQLHTQVVSDPGAAARLRGQASAIMAQRLEALGALIEQDPMEALRVALPPEVVGDLASSFPGARALLESHGTWEGPIEYVVADSVDFRSHRNFREMTVGGETLSIQFAGPEPAGLANGDVLRVNGVCAGTQIAAYSGTIVLASSSANRRPSSPPACTTIGPQKGIVLLVTMPGFERHRQKSLRLACTTRSSTPAECCTR
jgi:hypothetical protein